MSVMPYATPVATIVHGGWTAVVDSASGAGVLVPPAGLVDDLDFVSDPEYSQAMKHLNASGWMLSGNGQIPEGTTVNGRPVLDLEMIGKTAALTSEGWDEDGTGRAATLRQLITEASRIR
jgi:hypothetical protein